MYEADGELAKLESAAQNRGIYLDFQTYYEQSYVNAAVTLDNLTLYHDDCTTATGRDPATANQSLAAQLDVPQAFMVYAFNKYGRSAAYPLEGCECCFLFSGSYALRHEVCHVFGAADLYYTSEMTNLAKQYFTDSIMVDSLSNHIDDLTAYLIGWTDTLSYSAQGFLDSVSWMTQADLDAASEANTFTGYGTIQYDGCYYEGYIVNGFPHDQGTIYWDNGDVFQGQFNNGSQIGWGSYRWADGTYYEGEMKDYSPHGYGTMTWTNGYSQTGNWNMGQFMG